jgi:hypothetical protein
MNVLRFTYKGGIECIYASFPDFLYFNPSLAGKLLEPLLELQASGLSGNATAV